MKKDKLWIKLRQAAKAAKLRKLSLNYIFFN